MGRRHERPGREDLGRLADLEQHGPARRRDAVFRAGSRQGGEAGARRGGDLAARRVVEEGRRERRDDRVVVVPAAPGAGRVAREVVEQPPDVEARPIHYFRQRRLVGHAALPERSLGDGVAAPQHVPRQRVQVPRQVPKGVLERVAEQFRRRPLRFGRRLGVALPETRVVAGGVAVESVRVPAAFCDVQLASELLPPARPPGAVAELGPLVIF